METHVYINDREACSKAADGKSAAAFPDPCWSPPGPPSGPIVIPYPNTAHAKDLSNGSSSVFIKKTMVALEDHSFFATSEGDEGATDGFQKGVATNAKKGKAYFQSWSMNVSIEGFGVARHEDLMTHNHGSVPGNTATFPYIDSDITKSPCKEEKKKIDEKCKENESSERIKKPKSASKTKSSKKAAGKEAPWVLDHCGPLLVQPGIKNFKDWVNDFGDTNKLLSQAASMLKDQVIDKLESELKEYVAKKTATFIAKRALTSWIPVIGWVLTAADAVYTAMEVQQQAVKIKGQLDELKDIAQQLKESANKIKSLLGGANADKIINFKSLSKDEQNNLVNEVMAGTQAAYAAAQPCIKARKCSLLPFNRDGEKKWMGDGCCPGQTGHHLLPDAMFRDQQGKDLKQQEWKSIPGKKGSAPRNSLPKKQCWDGYDAGPAPTICLEGGGSSGSHGLMHKSTELAFKGYPREISYGEASKRMAEEVAKFYGCSKKCILAQLDAYYCNARVAGGPCPINCKDTKLEAHAGVKGGGKKDVDYE